MKYAIESFETENPLDAVGAGLRARGLSLPDWCVQNREAYARARGVISGKLRGGDARELRQRIFDDAGVRHVIDLK